MHFVAGPGDFLLLSSRGRRGERGICCFFFVAPASSRHPASGFASAPHAVVACGSPVVIPSERVSARARVRERARDLLFPLSCRSASYVTPQLVAQPLRPSASGACVPKRSRKGWGFFLLLSSRGRRGERGICCFFFVAPASSRHPASGFAGAPHAVVACGSLLSSRASGSRRARASESERGICFRLSTFDFRLLAFGFWLLTFDF